MWWRTKISHLPASLRRGTYIPLCLWLRLQVKVNIRWHACINIIFTMCLDMQFMIYAVEKLSKNLAGTGFWATFLAGKPESQKRPLISSLTISRVTWSLGAAARHTRALKRREERIVTPAMVVAMIGPIYSLRGNGAQHGGRFICASLLFRALAHPEGGARPRPIGPQSSSGLQKGPVFDPLHFCLILRNSKW